MIFEAATAFEPIPKWGHFDNTGDFILGPLIHWFYVELVLLLIELLFGQLSVDYQLEAEFFGFGIFVDFWLSVHLLGQRTYKLVGVYHVDNEWKCRRDSHEGPPKVLEEVKDGIESSQMGLTIIGKANCELLNDVTVCASYICKFLNASHIQKLQEFVRER